MISVYEIPLEKHIQKTSLTVKAQKKLNQLSHPWLIPGMFNIASNFIFGQELIKLETKGGPVQTLCLHNVTKFGSVDLIVGDSKGMLTFFGNKQILYKMAISEGCISAVTTDIDAGTSPLL